MEIGKEDLLNVNINLSEIAKQLKRIANKLDEWTYETCLAIQNMEQ